MIRRNGTAICSDRLDTCKRIIDFSRDSWCDHPLCGNEYVESELLRSDVVVEVIDARQTKCYSHICFTVLLNGIILHVPNCNINAFQPIIKFD
jgi:hypothetical protein